MESVLQERASEFRAARATRLQEGLFVGVYRYGGGEYQPRHAHDFTTISMILSGSLIESRSNETIRGEALHVVVKPRGFFHEDRFEGHGAALVQIALAGELERELAEAGAPLRRWLWSAGSAAVRPFVDLAGAGGKRLPRETCVELVEEVVAGVHPVRRARGPAPGWLRTVKTSLDEAARDPESAVSIASLAQHAKVHRVQLNRAFRRHFGLSPTEYRIRRRLSIAVDSLGSSDESLSDIAQLCGYTDQPHMNREFRSRLGITPLQYRHRVRSS